MTDSDEQNGELHSTPFHVRFGKLQLLRSTEKTVTLYVNDEPIPEVQMKLGRAGEAYFVEESMGGVENMEELLSPLTSPKSSPPRFRPDSLDLSTSSTTSTTAASNTSINKNSTGMSGSVSERTVASLVESIPAASSSVSLQVSGSQQALIIAAPEHSSAQNAISQALATGVVSNTVKAELQGTETSGQHAINNVMKLNPEVVKITESAVESTSPDKSIGYWSWGWGRLPQKNSTTAKPLFNASIDTASTNMPTPLSTSSPSLGTLETRAVPHESEKGKGWMRSLFSWKKTPAKTESNISESEQKSSKSNRPMSARNSKKGLEEGDSDEEENEAEQAFFDAEEPEVDSIQPKGETKPEVTLTQSEDAQGVFGELEDLKTNPEPSQRLSSRNRSQSFTERTVPMDIPNTMKAKSTVDLHTGISVDEIVGTSASPIGDYLLVVCMRYL